MPKYTISKGQQGDDILNINGVQSICPFVQALPMQGQYGQIQIMRLPCNSQCPHVKISDETYKVTCSGNLEIFRLEKNDDEVEILKSPLIVV